ncbi:hypothetical protein CYMTET_6975 [Cymbomonas tetramitiformis]|uniref:Glycosyltransferase 61 catalytic domain-containing protein n=1 Tax=Cymbomonas tetramitiformis TaxID=36881 RepID=A0AAE0GXV6_9CHLO|nr:hypothetical protein CYMTET_6975 [Cymbomonas tetramitiformis]
MGKGLLLLTAVAVIYALVPSLNSGKVQSVKIESSRPCNGSYPKCASPRAASLFQHTYFSGQNEPHDNFTTLTALPFPSTPAARAQCLLRTAGNIARSYFASPVPDPKFSSIEDRSLSTWRSSVFEVTDVEVRPGADPAIRVEGEDERQRLQGMLSRCNTGFSRCKRNHPLFRRGIKSADEVTGHERRRRVSSKVFAVPQVARNLQPYHEKRVAQRQPRPIEGAFVDELGRLSCHPKVETLAPGSCAGGYNDGTIIFIDRWGLNSYYHNLLDTILPVWSTLLLAEGGPGATLGLTPEEPCGEKRQCTVVTMTDHGFSPSWGDDGSSKRWHTVTGLCRRPPHFCEQPFVRELYNMSFGSVLTNRHSFKGGCYKRAIVGFAARWTPHQWPQTTRLVYVPELHWALKKYRNKIRRELMLPVEVPDATNGTKVVFVSRGSGGVKGILNEAGLISRAREAGFDIVSVRLERLTLQEQIRLASETAILVGVQGSGLVNSLYLPNGAGVLVLHVPNVDYETTWYDSIAQYTQLCITNWRLTKYNFVAPLKFVTALQHLVNCTQKNSFTAQFVPCYTTDGDCSE